MSLDHQRDQGALLTNAASYNTISRSLLMSGGAELRRALLASRTYNTVAQSRLVNPTATSVLDANASRNTISLSTITSDTPSYQALPSSRLFEYDHTKLHRQHRVATAPSERPSPIQHLEQSTVASNGAGSNAFPVELVFNTITGVMATNPAATAPKTGRLLPTTTP